MHATAFTAFTLSQSFESVKARLFVHAASFSASSKTTCSPTPHASIQSGGMQSWQGLFCFGCAVRRHFTATIAEQLDASCIGIMPDVSDLILCSGARIIRPELLEELPHIWRRPAKVLPFDQLLISGARLFHGHGPICYPAAGRNVLPPTQSLTVTACPYLKGCSAGLR